MLVSWIASFLTVVSYLMRSRPSDVIYEFFSAFGASSVANYFGNNAPQAIRFQSETAQDLIFWSIAMVATIMFGYVLIGGATDSSHLELRGNLLIISPWPNLIWLLLFVSIQIGPLPEHSGLAINNLAYATAKAFLGLLILTIALAALGLNRWLNRLSTAIIRLLWKASAHVFVSLGFIAVSLFMTLVWLPMEFWNIVDRRRHTGGVAIAIPEGARLLNQK